MAFNPFESFRKNSKPLMAALTIFVMIVFVLSTGGGGADFFDWFARQLGGKDQRGEVLGSIEDQEFYQANLQDLRQKRAAANAFMMGAVEIADQKMYGEIDQELKTIKDTAKQGEIRQALSSRETFLTIAGRVPARFRSEIAGNFYERYQQAQETAANLREKDNANEAQIYQFLSKIFYHDSIRVRYGNTLYFGRVPNLSDQDALQFEMYLKMADKMGVKYTANDVQRLIRSETDVELSSQDAARVDQFVRANRFRNLSADQLLQAISDEFRVMTVLKIVEGSDYSGRRSTPVALTPFELYEYYKDRCSEITFDVIDVPVEPFLAQVKDSPTENEQQRLFDKFKTQERDPSKETPGFKEPRKVRLEYLAVDASKPLYKSTLPLFEAVGLIGGGFATANLGAGPIAGALEVSSSLLAEPLLAKQERAQAEEFSRFRDIFRLASHFGQAPRLAQYLNEVADRAKDLPYFGAMGLRLMAETASKTLPARSLLDMPLVDGSVYNPLSVASLTGHLAVATSPFVSPYLASIGYRDLAELMETRDRTRLGVQLSVAPLSPLLTAFPIAAVAPVLANLPATPSGVYAKQIAGFRQNRRPQWVAEEDLKSLERKLDDLRKNLEADDAKKDDLLKKQPVKKDLNKIAVANAAARKLIDEWIQTHVGFDTGKSAALVDKYRLGDDAALKEIFADLKTAPNFQQDIEAAFFDPREANSSEVDLEAGKYKPLVMSDLQSTPERPARRDFSKPVYIAWKVDDRPAKPYDRYQLAPSEIHAEVIKAWKMEKARVLARQAADELAAAIGRLAQKELRDADNPAAFDKGLDDLAVAAKYDFLRDAIKIAKLKKNIPFHPENRNQQPTGYQPPTISNKKIEFPLAATLEKPDGGMAEQLLELRNKPIGDVLVLPNRPQSHFYVSVLRNKEDLTINDFYNNIFTRTNVPSTQFRDRDTLYQTAVAEALQAFEKDLLERIKAEMKYKETEALKEMKNRPADME